MEPLQASSIPTLRKSSKAYPVCGCFNSGDIFLEDERDPALELPVDGVAIMGPIWLVRCGIQLEMMCSDELEFLEDGDCLEETLGEDRELGVLGGDGLLRRAVRRLGDLRPKEMRLRKLFILKAM